MKCRRGDGARSVHGLLGSVRVVVLGAVRLESRAEWPGLAVPAKPRPLGLSIARRSRLYIEGINGTAVGSRADVAGPQPGTCGKSSLLESTPTACIGLPDLPPAPA